MKERFTYWYKVLRCFKCKKEVSSDVHAYCRGVCPHCGHSSNGTFLDVEQASVRERQVRGPWYWPKWKTVSREYTDWKKW